MLLLTIVKYLGLLALNRILGKVPKAVQPHKYDIWFYMNISRYQASFLMNSRRTESL